MPEEISQDITLQGSDKSDEKEEEMEGGEGKMWLIRVWDFSFWDFFAYAEHVDKELAYDE